MEPKPGGPVPPPFGGHEESVAADPSDHSSPIPMPKALKRWLPTIKALWPLVVGLVAIIDGRTGKHEVSEKTDTAYETLAPSTNANSKRIRFLEESVSRLAATVELQNKLLLAMQPGFTAVGVPTPAPTVPLTPATQRKKAKHVAKPADPALVNKVQTAGAKTLQDIKQRADNPAPVVVPVPATIPAQPPQAMPTAPPATISPLPAESK